MRTLILTLILIASSVFARERDMSERRAFLRENPKPAACQRCEVDHVQALMNGGSDTRQNMQWLPHESHLAKTKEDFKVHRLGTKHHGQVVRGVK